MDFFGGGRGLPLGYVLSFLMTELVGALLCFGVTGFDLVLVPGRQCLERCFPGCAFRIIDSKLNNADSTFLPVEQMIDKHVCQVTHLVRASAQPHAWR